MKAIKTYSFLLSRKIWASVFSFIFFPLIVQAQTTVVCTPTSGNSYWSSDPSAIVFGIRNTNNFPIVITGLSNYCIANDNKTYALWYHPTVTTGVPSSITTANGWVQVNAGTQINTTTAGVTPIFTGLNLTVPANTTYRLALAAISGSGSGPRYGTSSTTSPILFNNGGLEVYAQANPISPTYVGYYPNTVTNTPRSFYGTITFSPLPPVCSAPTSPNVTAITSTSAMLDWTQSGTPAQWEIKYGAPGFNVNTAGISIITSAKPYTLNPPLAEGTSYDYYVRAICGTNDTSVWSPVTNFTTICSPTAVLNKQDGFRCGAGPVTLEATASTGANIKWYATLAGGTALATGNIFTTPSNNTSTTYYVTAAKGNCESTPRQAVVATIEPLPVIALGNDTTICPGVSYTLDAGNSGAGYAWNTGANTQTIAVDTPGNYSVLVTMNGCNSSDTLVIVGGVVPQGVLPATTDLCDGDTAVIDAGNNGSSFVWAVGGETTQMVSVTAGGVKSVTITSMSGCVIVDSTNVIVHSLPVVNLGNDTAICNGSQITLDAGSNPDYTYLWLPGGETIHTITVADSGFYKVTVRTPFNCESTDEKHIAYLSQASVDGFNFIPLFHIQEGSIQFEPINPQSVSEYLWDFGDGNTATQASPVHVYATDGIYTVRLTVNNSCGSSDTSLVISVNRETGISKLDRKRAEFEVYPNPATSTLKIAARTPGTKISNIILLNSAGQSTSSSVKEGSDTYTLDVSKLNTGLYILCIYTEAGIVHKKINIVR